MIKKGHKYICIQDSSCHPKFSMSVRVFKGITYTVVEVQEDFIILAGKAMYTEMRQHDWLPLPMAKFNERFVKNTKANRLIYV